MEKEFIIGQTGIVMKVVIYITVKTVRYWSSKIAKMLYSKGDWKENMMNGKGKKTYASGAFYDGTWLNGKMIIS